MNLISHAKCGGQNKKTIISPLVNAEKFILNWTNYDNIAFYEEVASGLLQQLANDSGFDTCCDIELVKPYIFQKNSILEVGAGYGRVLNYLIENRFEGELFAIERGARFYNILQSKFQDRVKIFYTDLHDTDISQKFDVILWMWSGIADFSKYEQPIILNKLASFLKKDGFLIIDTAPALRKPINAIDADGQEYCIRLGNQINHVYCTSIEEINQYAENIGLTVIKNLEYQTPIKRVRYLHILRK